MSYKIFIEKVLKESGEIALRNFGRIKTISQKDDPSQVVTKVDLEIEKKIISDINSNYPTHSIIAEESGLNDKNSEYTWVIDPLDGTSNYAAGIPWFGIMITLLKGSMPLVSGIYLPSTKEIYLAEQGNGSFLNGSKISLSQETSLKNCLVCFDTDPGSDDDIAYYAQIYKKLLPKVRNLRSTNSALDYAYSADGRLGGLINTNNALWDIAPILLIAKEAGGFVTDLNGESINLKIDKDSLNKKYTLLLGSKILHPLLLSCTS